MRCLKHPRWSWGYPSSLSRDFQVITSFVHIASAGPCNWISWIAEIAMQYPCFTKLTCSLRHGSYHAEVESLTKCAMGWDSFNWSLVFEFNIQTLNKCVHHCHPQNNTLLFNATMYLFLLANYFVRRDTVEAFFDLLLLTVSLYQDHSRPVWHHHIGTDRWLDASLVEIGVNIWLI